MSARHTQTSNSTKLSNAAFIAKTQQLVSVAQYASDMGFYDMQDENSVEHDIEQKIQSFKAKKN